MAAKTTGNTVKRAALKGRPSSKPLRATSKTAAILKRLRIKQRKTQKSSKPSIEKPHEWSELLTLQEHSIQHSLHIHRNAQRLSKVESDLQRVLRHLSLVDQQSLMLESLRSRAACELPNETPQTREPNLLGRWDA